MIMIINNRNVSIGKKQNISEGPINVNWYLPSYSPLDILDLTQVVIWYCILRTVIKQVFAHLYNISKTGSIYIYI